MNARNNSHDAAALVGEAHRDHYTVTRQEVDMTRPPEKVLSARMPAQPQDIAIDLHKTALIVVDMQNDFCKRGGWFDSLGFDVSGTNRLVDPIKKVVSAMRARSVPIIWLNWGVRGDKANLPASARYTFNRIGCGVGLADPIERLPAAGSAPAGVLQKDSWGAAVIDDLGALGSDTFVDKHRISGFWDTPLDSILRARSIKTLVFAGINADECVMATLMDANFHGYDTILVEDATATSSPDFCFQATLWNVRFCFGFTVTSADLSNGVAQARTHSS